MRKSTFLLAGLIGFSTWALPTKPIMSAIQDDLTPWNLNFRSPNEKIPHAENAFSQERLMPKTKTRVRNNAPIDASYYVAAQSFYNDYVFYYNGGLVYSYDIDIEVDGDKAIIRHLFDLEAQSTDWSINESYDLIGHYDSESATITIPTSQDFSEATFVGTTMSGYYYEMLVSGKVLEDGTLDPSDELIFKVVGDFEAITTDMDFGIMNCIDTGEAYGLYEIYRSFYATIPTDEPKLVAMGNIVPIADTYANTTSNTTFWVANMSNSEVDFSASFGEATEIFSISPEVGFISPKGVCEFTVEFIPTEIKEYETILYIEYDGIDESPEPLEVICKGNSVSMPNYSEVVKEGDFSFFTTIDFPFIIDTLEDGRKVARSTTDGQRGTSQLIVEFEIPQNNVGHLSWQGGAVITNLYNNAAGYFVDNSDMATESAFESGDLSADIKFGPGKHSVRFQFEGYRRGGDPKNYMFVYDLDLSFEEAPLKAISVDNPVLQLENLLISDNNPVESRGIITLRNMGTDPLQIVNMEVEDSQHFSVTAPKILQNCLKLYL